MGNAFREGESWKSLTLRAECSLLARKQVHTWRLLLPTFRSGW